MTKLVPDIRQIRIETWKANHRILLAMGCVFIAAGLYRFEADEWALSKLVAVYLVIGPLLLVGGLWLIARGPLLEIEDDGDDDEPPEPAMGRGRGRDPEDGQGYALRLDSTAYSANGGRHR